MERGVYGTNNQPKRETFKYEQEGRFYLGVDKVEGKEDGKITGKRCPVFDYTRNKIFTIDALKNPNTFAIIRKLTSFSSPWVGEMKTDKICLYESVGKLKRIRNQGEAKMNEVNIHTISDLQRCFRSYGLPKLRI